MPSQSRLVGAEQRLLVTVGGQGAGEEVGGGAVEVVPVAVVAAGGAGGGGGEGGLDVLQRGAEGGGFRWGGMPGGGRGGFVCFFHGRGAGPPAGLGERPFV